jgi:hypothetical protein
LRGGGGSRRERDQQKHDKRAPTGNEATIHHLPPFTRYHVTPLITRASESSRSECCSAARPSSRTASALSSSRRWQSLDIRPASATKQKPGTRS